MTRRLLIALLLACSGFALAPAAPAAAGCALVETVTYVDDLAMVTAELVCDSVEDIAEGDGESTPGTPVGQAACIGMANLLGQEVAEFCQGEPDEATVTPGIVAAALRRVPLPPSELIVQPPNGRTLVNFDTNFYTETEPLDRTIRLFGQQVDLRIWPSSYEWHFGDGASTATESAGSPYPDLEITHSYTAKGQVGPAVDTTYSAEFRVNGGAWRPVPGTVTIPGDAVALEVVEATPVLVGYS